MNYKIDVNIVDDHTMLLQGITDAINKSEVVHVSHTFTTIEACRSHLAEWRPDVLLLDLSMPDGSGIEFCEWLMATYPSVKIVIVTCHDEYSVIRRMIDLGVNGYVLKSSDIEDLVAAINAVYHGGRYVNDEVKAIIEKGEEKQVFLTSAERNVLSLICQGLSNPQIASQLGMSIETANWYRKRLLAKFNMTNSTSLVAHVLREHILDGV